MLLGTTVFFALELFFFGGVSADTEECSSPTFKLYTATRKETKFRKGKPGKATTFYETLDREDQERVVSISKRKDGTTKTVNIANAKDGYLFRKEKDGTCTNVTWEAKSSMAQIPASASFIKKENINTEEVNKWRIDVSITLNKNQVTYRQLWSRASDCMIVKEGLYKPKDNKPLEKIDEDVELKPVFEIERSNVVFPKSEAEEVAVRNAFDLKEYLGLCNEKLPEK